MNASDLDARSSGSATFGLARYASDLPVVDDFVSLGEGQTPTIELPRLAAHLGLNRLSAKAEYANPTGSYKDRVAAMSISLALTHRNRGWIATSSGNAGAALSAYGARAGLPGFLCVVAGAPEGKLRPLVPYGARVLGIDGIGTGGNKHTTVALLTAVQQAAARHDLFLAITAHAFNPMGMRGIDTLAFELTEQAPSVSHVYVPTGGGGLISAIARGLGHRGHDGSVVAVQPDGCAPIVRFLNGEISFPGLDECTSAISALQLPEPPDGQLAVEAVRLSGGWGTSASDADILLAQTMLAELEGVLVEPASASTVAALERDVALGRITSKDHPVLVLSGGGWKDLSQYRTRSRDLENVRMDEVARTVQSWVESTFSGEDEPSASGEVQ